MSSLHDALGSDRQLMSPLGLGSGVQNPVTTERYAVNNLAQLGTTAFSPASNCTVGTKLIMLSPVGTSIKAYSSIADSKGNTWRVSSFNDGTKAVSMAECDVTTAILTTDTITITWSSAVAANCPVVLEEVTSLATGGFDKSASGTGTNSTPLTSATAALSQAGAYVVSTCRASGVSGLAWTKGSTYTNPTTPTLPGTTTNLGAYEYKLAPGTTAITADGTLGSPVTPVWLIGVWTFKLRSA